jgi:hypothetical protein
VLTPIGECGIFGRKENHAREIRAGRAAAIRWVVLGQYDRRAPGSSVL